MKFLFAMMIIRMLFILLDKIGKVEDTKEVESAEDVKHPAEFGLRYEGCK
jgi:hypothetical protein